MVVQLAIWSVRLHFEDERTQWSSIIEGRRISRIVSMALPQNRLRDW